MDFFSDTDRENKAAENARLGLVHAPAIEFNSEFRFSQFEFEDTTRLFGFPVNSVPRSLSLSFSYVHLPLQLGSPLANSETDVILHQGQSEIMSLHDNGAWMAGSVSAN